MEEIRRMLEIKGNKHSGQVLHRNFYCVGLLVFLVVQVQLGSNSQFATFWVLAPLIPQPKGSRQEEKISSRIHISHLTQS